jgi:hypothetical protein
MPNPNISAVLAGADKTTMKANVDANKVFIDPFGVNLTPEQRKTIAKTGSDSVSYVQDGLTSVTNHPEILPGDMDAAEYGKDVKLFSDLNDLYNHHLPYFELIGDTMVAVGSECILQTNRIYASAKDQAKNNNALQGIVDLLGKRYEKLKGPKKRFASQKVLLSPGSSVSLTNVAASSPFSNDGAASLMLCQGALAKCEAGTTYTPAATGTVPAGITTITVTNLSVTENGSFTVKVEVV